MKSGRLRRPGGRRSPGPNACNHGLRCEYDRALNPGVGRQLVLMARALRKHSLGGKMFGSLLVLERVPSANGKVRWRCRCSCGRTSELSTQDLVRTDGRAVTGCRACSYEQRERMPIQEVKRRLQDIHGDQVSVVDGSYRSASRPCQFVDAEFGRFTATPSNIFATKRRHPKFGKNQTVLKLSLSPSAARRRVEALSGGIVTLDEKTFAGRHSACSLMDREYGPYRYRYDSFERTLRRHRNYYWRVRVERQHGRMIGRRFGNLLVIAPEEVPVPGRVSDHGHRCRYKVQCMLCNGFMVRDAFAIQRYNRSCGCKRAAIAESNGALSTNADKVLSLEEVVARLDIVHGGAVQLVEATYVKASAPAVFVDVDHGAWTVVVSQVLGGHGHPQRGLVSRMDKRRTSKEELVARIREVHRGDLEIDISSFKDQLTKARFLDREHGWYEATPASVLCGTGHPARRREKTRSTYMRLYGVPHNMQHPELARKNAQASNIARSVVHWRTGETVWCRGSY